LRTLTLTQKKKEEGKKRKKKFIVDRGERVEARMNTIPEGLLPHLNE